MAKKKTTRKKTPQKAVEKSQQLWTPVGNRSARGTYDAFHSQAEPTKYDLVGAYQDIVGACVETISNKIADAKIRLYVKMTGNKPKSKTLTVERKNFATVRTLAGGANVREVIDHPFLDLITKCNPFHNRRDLTRLTSQYLELTGNAYWRLVFQEYHTFRVPKEVYPLASQDMTPLRDENGYIYAWEYGSGTDTVTIPKDEILHFKYSNPSDPYGEGVSPLRLAWQRKQIGDKELAYLESLLENMGRPDILVSIKDSINPLEAERLAKEWEQRFSKSGNGGIMVVDGTTNATPLNYPPKDLAELELYQVIKTTICNCYGIPPDFFESGQSSNRSTREAALYQLAEHCLKHRVEEIVDRLNSLVHYFDDRLFFAADPVVPEDKEFELQKSQMLFQTGSVLREEIREVYGYEPAEWATIPLLPSGMMPAPMAHEITQSDQGDDGEATDAVDNPHLDVNTITALQQIVYSGQLPREAAIANIRINYGYPADVAAQFFPDVALPVRPAPQPAPEVPKPPEPSAPKPEPEAKSFENEVIQKVMKLKSASPLVDVLSKFFEFQGKSILSQTKAEKAIGDDFDLHHWTREMYNEVFPTMKAYWDHGAKAAISQLNISDSFFNTVQPGIADAVQHATLLFCRETNETTRLELSEAQKQLREELTQGLIDGDVKQLMADRVKKIFEDASNERAFRIAVTESSRGQHAALELTAQESGVATGKKWLTSANSCPECQALNGKVVPLGENFAVNGSGPYAEIRNCPAHPHCACTMLLVTD